jgi:hypothetical protein
LNKLVWKYIYVPIVYVLRIPIALKLSSVIAIFLFPDSPAAADTFFRFFFLVSKDAPPPQQQPPEK